MIIILILAVLALLVLAAEMTNPFSRVSIVRQPFVINANGKELQVVNENHKIVIRQNWLWQRFAYLKCGLHTLSSRYIHSPAAPSHTLDRIITDIHALRFRPDKLLLISGDHFNALFVRNLGVFYYPMLDKRIPGTVTDWHNRQMVYAQTVAFALGVFAKRPIPVTTLVTTGAYAATCVNIAEHAYPSDTVYGVLYALAALSGLEDATAAPGLVAPKHRLATHDIAHLLQRKYRATLQELYAHYRSIVFDPSTHLIRSDIHLSGAKDITTRASAFYDNVIFWKTTELAGKLGLIPHDTEFLAGLKTRILDAFWLEEKGHFLEDLSPEGRERSYYSSDWLIVLTTGFLSPERTAEQGYFEKSVSYIQSMRIDEPFAIKYQHERRAHRQFILARLAMAAYGGDAIWSFWGMEYIKVLLLLYKKTGRSAYLERADFHINAYETAMVKYRGFPEVYDQYGIPLKTWYYRSIRQTGWVIGFEQVHVMRNALGTNTVRKAAHV